MTRKNRELDSPVIGHGGLFTDDNIGEGVYLLQVKVVVTICYYK